MKRKDKKETERKIVPMENAGGSIGQGSKTSKKLNRTGLKKKWFLGLYLKF